MISPQARIVKSFLKATKRKKGYTTEQIQQHRKSFERNLALLFPSLPGKLRWTQIAGVRCAWITPPKCKDRTIVYLHGGGFVFGSLKTHQQHMLRLAKMCRAKVLAIEYGLSPEKSYPVPLDEIERVWKSLTKRKDFDASRTVLMGDSAGGNLALASALHMRDAHLPLPACLVLLYPPLDGTFSGKSYTLNASKDVLIDMEKLEFFASSYTQQHPRTLPLVSPVFANLKGLPPMLVHAASDELMLSDSEAIVKNARRDGVKAELFIGKDMWHSWHLFAAYVPEARKAMRAIAKYILANTKD